MRSDVGTRGSAARAWRIAIGVVLAGLSAAACGSDAGDDGDVGAGARGDSGDKGNIDDFDPNQDADGDGTADTGPSCDAVDILFVIDNSPSMKPYQEGLAAAFPGFVDAMFEVLPKPTSLHVGITTSSFWAGECGEGHINCQTTATAEEVEAHYMSPMEGSTGVNGEQGRLFEYEGERFVATDTASDAGGLEQWFAGAAVAAGETGCSFEMTSAGAGYVAHPANQSDNGGFLRDEKTVLLVFVLSDEPDKSPEGVVAYAEMLRNAKAGCGGDKCIVTSGLVTPCVMAGQNQLSEFLNGFGEDSVLGSIEEPEKYTEVVGAGLAQVVQQACAAIGSPD
jgi:hypothetical protein